MSNEDVDGLRVEASENEFDATIDELALIVSSIYPGNKTGTSDELYRRLAHSLGGDSAPAPPVSDKRSEELKKLIDSIEAVRAQTEWTPEEFRDVVGCHHGVGTLYSDMSLSRCLALLGLLTTNLHGVTNPAAARLTAELTVEAFRYAEGDPELTIEFWTKPLRSKKAARDYVAEGDDVGAMHELNAHGASRPMGYALELPDALMRRVKVPVPQTS